MKRVKVDKWNPDPEIIARAAEILRRGGIVAFPTETVYGLGANGLDGTAVRKIFEAKGRPADNPLILHISNPKEAEKIAFVNDAARGIMREFFPAPLTLVLPVKPCVPREVTAGLNSVAFRMPAHPIALALIEKTGAPIAAPSANKSGRPSPTNADAVIEDFGDELDLVLDGGECDIGVESTVIDVRDEKIYLLRPGGMPIEIIENFLKSRLHFANENQKIVSPGTRHRHYAPKIPLYLWRRDENMPCEGLRYGYMGFCEPNFFPDSVCKEKIIFENIENYARGIFAGLRRLERCGADCIIAELPSMKGMGRALNDRLTRAAC